MPPFTPIFPAPSQHGMGFAALLDLVRRRLVSLCGHQFIATLDGGNDGTGASRYHLALEHVPSRVYLEDSGRIGGGFVEHVLCLGMRTKTMLESPTFSRMCSDDPKRPLVWLSDSGDMGAEALLLHAARMSEGQVVAPV